MGKQESLPSCSLLAVPVPVTSDLDMGSHGVGSVLGKMSFGSSSPFLLTVLLMIILSYKRLKETLVTCTYSTSNFYLFSLFLSLNCIY